MPENPFSFIASDLDWKARNHGCQTEKHNYPKEVVGFFSCSSYSIEQKSVIVAQTFMQMRR
jgi:hypothetical protein